MPPPAFRDDLDCTVVKPIAIPTTPQKLAPLEDLLSPATEARAATTANIRRLGPLASSRKAVERAMKRLVSDYRELSTAKRLRIPLAIIILVLAGAPSPSRAGEAATRPVAPAAVTTTTTAMPKPVVRPSVAVATPAGGPQAALPPSVVLPSARALLPSSQTALSPEERRQYDRAITATLARDFDAAEAIYAKLSAAHPESAELSAAARVLAAKKKKKAGR